MKKLFTFLFIASAAVLAQAQSSIQLWRYNNTGTVIAGPINNGDTLSFNTTANGLKTINTRFKNVGSSSITYSAKRWDVALGSGASAYFCMGGICFGPGTTVTPTSNWVTLSPSAQDSSFIIDLNEGPAQSYSMIRYKLYNTANPHDTLSFVFKYNQSLGINDISSVIESASDVYPNPSAGSANISVTVKQETDLKLQVYNSLGALVYSAPSQKYVPGKHKLSVDCSAYNNGLYFMTVSVEGRRITKRFIVNK